MKRYKVNEVFYSVQGEGVLAGTPMTFVRFADCNLRCTVGSAGFDCDTEFSSGQELDAEELLGVMALAHGEASEGESNATWTPPMRRWVLLTGGEPALQVDAALLQALTEAGYRIAIETNGTHALPDGFDHVCVSPKTAEHTLRQLQAAEVKYVRRAGQAIPVPTVSAQHWLLSPAVQPDGSIVREDLEHCIALVKAYPRWRLSVQQHKGWKVR